MHHAGTQAGQFEHLVIAQLVQSLGTFHQSRIGRVDAIHVGVDLAACGTEHGGQGHGGGIAAATTERGNVLVLVNPLEAGSDHDIAVIQQLFNTGCRNRDDAGLGVRAVGTNTDLCTRQADCLVP